MEPQRRRLFHHVFMQTPEGRTLYSILLTDLGLFAPALRSTRAVAMRDVAAHLLNSLGIIDHPAWLHGWIEQQGNPIIQENLRMISEHHSRQRADPPPGSDLDDGPPGVL